MPYVAVAPVPPVPSLDLLTYAVPEHLAGTALPGVRVLVPLARRTVTGIVVEEVKAPPEGVSARDLVAVLDEEPIIGRPLLALARWMADYYLTSLAEILSLAVGKGLTTSSRRLVELADAGVARSPAEKRIVAELQRAGKPIETARLARKTGGSFYSTLGHLLARGAVRIHEHLPAPPVRARTERVVRATVVSDAQQIEAALERAPKRRRIYEYLLERPGRQATMAELTEAFGRASDCVAALCDAGLVSVEERETYRSLALVGEAGETVELSEAQALAVGEISESLGRFAPFLLHGVTASGKTEVYLRVIEKVLARGAAALVLVPEISLTHQVVARLVGRFGPTVAVLHSDLTPRERWDEWRRTARGEARIVVGARSAVLAPIDNLGLVIVDEEHDGAYKQGEGPRYHGRDVAVLRARLAECPVVLGSATPSAESFFNATSSTDRRYRYLELPERVTEHPLPAVEVVDLRGRDIAARGGLSEHLATLLERNFQAGGQSLLFINRRGYAAGLQCYECGDIVECRSCSVSMTLHRQERRLRCHHCNASRPVPERCPACARDALVTQGIGTERLEASVRALLPSARVARLDRDVASRRGRAVEVLAAWRSGRIDVLVGTQMITKGHDVAGVSLVGVVLADLSLGLPDFRAAERTFQLLSQVAGRAGRGAMRGRVVVQTYRPDHFAVAAAVRHDYRAFAERELAERADLGYPPHTRMALVRIEGRRHADVVEVARLAARAATRVAKADPRLIVRGPAPSPIERLKGRTRYQIQLRAPTSRLVRHAAAACRHAAAGRARRDGVRLILDIDPVDVL